MAERISTWGLLILLAVLLAVGGALVLSALETMREREAQSVEPFIAEPEPQVVIGSEAFWGASPVRIMEVQVSAGVDYMAIQNNIADAVTIVSAAATQEGNARDLIISPITLAPGEIYEIRRDFASCDTGIAVFFLSFTYENGTIFDGSGYAYRATCAP